MSTASWYLTDGILAELIGSAAAAAAKDALIRRRCTTIARATSAKRATAAAKTMPDTADDPAAIPCSGAAASATTA
jgi:hypothetical protein